MGFEPLSPKDYKKIFPDMDQEDDSYYVYLSIIDFECSHTHITTTLGLEPFKERIKGSKLHAPNGQFIRMIEENVWSHKLIGSKGDSSELIEKYAYEIIKPRIDKINSLAKGAELRLTVVEEYHSSFNPGYYLESKVVNILSEINCSLEFDIYCMREG